MRLRFKTRLLNKEKFYFIACSGGIDSVAITHYLVTRFFKESPFILHVNNHLFETDKIAAQNVARLASSLECTYIEKEHTIYNNDLINLEVVCRQTRLSSYFECESDVIVCHHLDDAIESYLMNCFNGTPEYLPIPETTKLSKHKGSIYRTFVPTIIRPFLTTVTKKDLEKYCMKNNLMQYVVEDPLNQKSNRGWLRREVLPLIKQKYPGIDKVVRKKYL